MMGVNATLKRFNGWFDDFILEAAKPMSLLGFAMGTVDIFTRGILTQWEPFNIAWAIVQAVTIDGLFFAVWYRLFSLKWESKNIITIIGFGFIGIILGVVVTITNSILSMQQLWGVVDSQAAMIKLGIDPTLFTLVRAILVVAVTIMVAFVYHSRSTDSVAVAQVAPVAQKRSTPTSRVTVVAQPVAQIAYSVAPVARSVAQPGLIARSVAGLRHLVAPEYDAIAQRSTNRVTVAQDSVLRSTSAGSVAQNSDSVAQIAQSVARSTNDSTTRSTRAIDELNVAQDNVARSTKTTKPLIDRETQDKILSGANLKQLSSETGIAYSTLTKYRRQLSPA